MSENRGEKDARILVIEDSPVVSLHTEDLLRDEGYFVVGPAYDMAAATDLATREQVDAAIVDLNIRGEKAFSVLSILKERDIPFIITSGYANWSMPDEWQTRPRLQKPFNDQQLLAGLERLLTEKATS
ncbi:response regulator [Sphingomicrobium sediminis]|uniref:Response regulator n=1 Tax=Sphingomicrobium sediminis TaxID=2950949 RepID=A0A9X2EJH0_9SPHN|nr:response regulator [Sphingomicrobium sediminis]MCM8556412.1 response regulator [Sphingomicrobium sediminis]